MNQAIKIYKNTKSFNNAIMIEIENHDVTSINKSGNIVELYNENNLIGLNIFDKNLFEDKEEGFIYPEQAILDELNNYLNKKSIDLNFKYNKEEFLKVAKVLEVKKVKGSDNLTLCKVSVSDKEYSMICGADNVKEGMKTIAALDNALLSDGTKVTAGEVLGVYSEGMLCSLKELGLDNDNKFSGIVDLDADEEVGISFFDVDWRKYNV